jgi:hypothetical protein
MTVPAVAFLMALDSSVTLLTTTVAPYAGAESRPRPVTVATAGAARTFRRDLMARVPPVGMTTGSLRSAPRGDRTASGEPILLAIRASFVVGRRHSTCREGQQYIDACETLAHESMA